MAKTHYDFSGWATRNDVRCSDNRIIRSGAFDHDQQKPRVPLIWNHRHDDPNCVLGHADLEQRPDGVFAYCSLNNTKQGRTVKELLRHGDVNALSIFANQLRQRGSDVLHGTIREVSVVLSGANPEAYITDVLTHSDMAEDPIVYICRYGTIDTKGGYIEHADDDYEEDYDMAREYDDDLEDEIDEYEDYDEDYDDEDYDDEDYDDEDHDDEDYDDYDDEDYDDEDYDDYDDEDYDDDDEQLGDVIDTMDDKQYNTMMYMVQAALEQGAEDAAAHSDDYYEGDIYDMRYNPFEPVDEIDDGYIMHADDIDAMFEAARRDKVNSLREHIDVIMHSDSDYGVDDIDMLFPEPELMDLPPEFISREMTWVDVIMSGVHNIGITRIKSMYANITEDEARAKGYIKGNYKKEEVFSLLKRTTSPTTIYKKQKLDRDDIVDIKDFDAVAWLKSEMRMMLDEEIARAILIGDGRLNSDTDKIKEDCIRPIAKEHDFFAIKYKIGAQGLDAAEKAKRFIRGCVKARKDYKGSGSPMLITTEDNLTEMLLLQDAMGRDLYTSEDQLRTKLRVSRIVTTPVLENSGIEGIIVNLSDYAVGTDKGGQVSMFSDFDIDFNQEKYLIETRCSGSLRKPFSAIVVSFDNNSTDDSSTGFFVPEGKDIDKGNA